MKRFEFKQGSFSKFWEISRVQQELTVSWGRIGTEGQRKTTTFPSDDEAEKKEWALITEKLDKGYVAIDSANTHPSAKQPVRPSMEPVVRKGLRAVLQDATGCYLVLTQLGKHVIVGEGSDRVVQNLPSVKSAEEHFQRLRTIREKSGYKLLRLEELSQEELDPPNVLEAAGFEGEARVEDGKLFVTFRGDEKARISSTVCHALVERIQQLAPRCVQFICDFSSPKSTWATALQGNLLPSVEFFIFDTHFQTQTRQTENSIGDLAAVLNACPNLRNLFATGDLYLNPVEHPNLKNLHLLGNPLSKALLDNLGKCKFPALETLAVSLTSDASARNQSDLISALLSVDASRLSEVHISGVANIPKCLEGILEERLPAQIRKLSITDSGEISFEEVSQLLRNRMDRFSSFEVLALPLDTLDPPEPLRTQIPCLVNSDGMGEAFLPQVYTEW